MGPCRTRLGRAGCLAALATLAVAASDPVAGSEAAAASARTIHYEYVLNNGGIHVYDIDHANRYVGKLDIPQLVNSHGVVAAVRTGMLYISYGGQGGPSGSGSLLAYDLRARRVVWTRSYSTGIDSLAITPDGRTIYLPDGESSDSTIWRVIEAATGNVTGAIEAGSKPHNTIVSQNGKYVYLGGCGSPYLAVASTATNTVVRRIGPLDGPGVRPFTVNGSDTLAFTTTRSHLGFQVSAIRTGKVLYTVSPAGFTWDPHVFGETNTPDHGISLSPDERELYLIDTPNGYVHVFDVSGLPTSAPRKVASIKMHHPPPSDGWLQHSGDGHYVYVGRAGDVIDTTRRKVVAFLRPVHDSADFLEIDWRNGRPIATTSRYGVGHVLRPR